MVMDVNQTYCGDCFAIYTNIKSLCCMPETNIVCQLYLNKKNNRRWEKNNFFKKKKELSDNNALSPCYK